MSIEIKFRRSHFIDEECKIFHHSDFWGVKVGIHGANFTSPSQNNTALYYIDDQLTGEVDKIGSVIYSGDILRVKSGTATPINIIHEGENLTAYRPIYHTCVVVFYKSAFCLHNSYDTTKHSSESAYSGTSYYGTLQSASYDKEVIGNIHENPELL